MTTEDAGRIAVFSDVHGNLHALNAVLDSIDQHQIRTIMCLGDVVGYGAYPNECCEALRFRRIPTVAGNHDHAALGKTDIKFFNDVAKAAVQWTTDRLARENSRWLGRLPFTRAHGPSFFVHATPHEPDKWGYILTFGDARVCFADFKQKFCFVGHSHQPTVVEQDGEELRCPEGNLIAIDPQCRYLINVGSVGQPRDHNPNACYVILDPKKGLIEFHRVPYDITAAQQAILGNGLPPELAERLAYGW